MRYFRIQASEKIIRQSERCQKPRKILSNHAQPQCTPAWQTWQLVQPCDVGPLGANSESRIVVHQLLRCIGLSYTPRAREAFDPCELVDANQWMGDEGSVGPGGAWRTVSNGNAARAWIWAHGGRGRHRQNILYRSRHAAPSSDWKGFPTLEVRSNPNCPPFRTSDQSDPSACSTSSCPQSSLSSVSSQT